MLVQIAAAGAIPRDADERALAELSQSQGPLFYSACDFVADDPVRRAHHDERLIWLVNAQDGSSILLIHDKPSGENLLAMDCSPDSAHTHYECDINVGSWAWELYGIAEDGLLTQPSQGYRMTFPKPDFMAAILSDTTVDACKMPKPRPPIP